MKDTNTAVTNNEISFEIVEHLGILRTSAAGWSRELNLISWNGRPPKYDIRDWTPDHTKSSKGITFTDYEMQQIVELMKARNT